MHDPTPNNNSRKGSNNPPSAPMAPVVSNRSSSSPVLNSNHHYDAPTPPPPPGFQPTLMGVAAAEANTTTKNNFDLSYSYTHTHTHEPPPPSLPMRQSNYLEVPALFESPPPPSRYIGVVAEASPQNFGGFGGQSPSSLPYDHHNHGPPSTRDGGASTIHENPFRNNSNSNSSSNNYTTFSRYQEHLDSQIEADLQELGGQMAGSILDF
eukprot:jgi/Psemu1/301243/fgenesh1_kg.28_\